MIRAWWDQVTVKLNETKIIALRKGISKGLNGKILLGGHDWPILIMRANEEWKYAQKKEIKKKISEIINKIIAIFIPLKTSIEWHSW